MKIKKYLAGSLLALLSLTTACTNEELVPSEGNGNGTEQLPDGAVQFKIDGINTGAVETRAVGGTVIASAQENRVDHLTILVFGAEKENATPQELTFRDYWTSEKRADYICDTEYKTFALKGMGKYYTATVVVPADLKSTGFLFLVNKPRLFDMRPVRGTGTGVMPELRNLYKAGSDHLHTGYAFDGMNLREVADMIVASEAIDGVGVPAGYLTTVPNTLPCDKPVFEMHNNYFGFEPGVRETLAMTGISTDPVSADGQSMGVVLHRNVARIDVSVDGGISLSELKLTNIGALSVSDRLNITDQWFDMGVSFDANAANADVRSTFSLMTTDDAGQLIVPARSYCYPSVEHAEVKLIGKQTDGSEFTIPFVDKDTKQPLKIENNHRYTIKVRRTSDNSIDANIIVEAWNVGDEIDVDLNGGDALTPAPALYDASNYEYAQWESMGKVTCAVSNNYTLNSTNPATYPWLRFDLKQMSSLGLRMYYKDQEVSYPGAFFDPNMQVHNTTESADGTQVRHELMVTFPMVSTQWLKLQNNFDPSLNYVVKIETGNLEATGTNAKTPALLSFTETNVSTAGTALINFPSGGFDGPYCKPVADWTTYRGQQTATPAVGIAGYALPTAEQLQCIAPDENWGRFDTYNGANVVKTILNNDLIVYYSGSPLDRNVVKVVVDRTQAGTNQGTASQYVNVEATLWHYSAEGYLKVNAVNVSMSGSDAGHLTSYTALMDIFNNTQDVSAGYTRFFPAAATDETAYLGEGTSAMVFSSTEVKYVPDYAGQGYIRPVMRNGSMSFPVRQPVLLPARVIVAPVVKYKVGTYTVATGGTNEQGTATFADAAAKVPAGYSMPTGDNLTEMAGVTIDQNGATVTNADFIAAFPDTGDNGAFGTMYWLGDVSTTDGAAWCLVAIGNEYGLMLHDTTSKAVKVRYVKK